MNISVDPVRLPRYSGVVVVNPCDAEEERLLLLSIRLRLRQLLHFGVLCDCIKVRPRELKNFA
jgi:hypothetical protein